MTTTAPETQQESERQQHDRDHGHRARHPPALQQAHGGRQQERQEQRDSATGISTPAPSTDRRRRARSRRSEAAERAGRSHPRPGYGSEAAGEGRRWPLVSDAARRGPTSCIRSPEWTSSPATPRPIPTPRRSSRASGGCPGASTTSARNRLAHALADLGLAAGEHAVLYAHNSLEVLLASAAVARARRHPGADEPPAHRRGGRLHPRQLRRRRRLRQRRLRADARARARAGAAAAPRIVLLGEERRPWAQHLDDLVAAGRPEPVDAAGRDWAAR